MRHLPLIGGVTCDAVWERSEGASGRGRREGSDLLALALSRSGARVRACRQAQHILVLPELDDFEVPSYSVTLGHFCPGENANTELVSMFRISTVMFCPLSV